MYRHFLNTYKFFLLLIYSHSKGAGKQFRRRRNYCIVLYTLLDITHFISKKPTCICLKKKYLKEEEEKNNNEPFQRILNARKKCMQHLHMK